jgi:Serine carboxypeptidase
MVRFYKHTQMSPSLTLIDSRNFLPMLQEIVNKNITTLIWAGDADWICNWKGNLLSAEDIKYPGQDKFKKAALKSYTVKGEKKGEYKAADNLSFLRVYKAGHTVMAYRKLTLFQEALIRKLTDISRARCIVTSIHANYKTTGINTHVERRIYVNSKFN